MANLLFSPKGAIDPSSFLKSGFLLIFLGFALIALGFFLPFDGRLAVLVSFFLGIPWIFVWIKRLRFGGASPALVLVYLALYALLFFCLLLASLFLFSGGGILELASEYARQEISMEEYQAGLQANMDPMTMLRNLLVSGLIASLITLFVGNAATPKKATQD